MTKNKTKTRFRGKEKERGGQEEVLAATVAVEYQQ
jgi:hypothetical protein